MNVEIKTEDTTVIGNPNCKVTMLNGKITSIHVERADYVGGIEFETKFGEFEQFVQNCVDVYHTVRLEQINELRQSPPQPQGLAEAVPEVQEIR